MPKWAYRGTQIVAWLIIAICLARAFGVGARTPQQRLAGLASAGTWVTGSVFLLLLAGYFRPLKNSDDDERHVHDLIVPVALVLFGQTLAMHADSARGELADHRERSRAEADSLNKARERAAADSLAVRVVYEQLYANFRYLGTNSEILRRELDLGAGQTSMYPLSPLNLDWWSTLVRSDPAGYAYNGQLMADLREINELTNRVQAGIDHREAFKMNAPSIVNYDSGVRIVDRLLLKDIAQLRGLMRPQLWDSSGAPRR